MSVFRTKNMPIKPGLHRDLDTLADVNGMGCAEEIAELVLSEWVAKQPGMDKVRAIYRAAREQARKAVAEANAETNMTQQIEELP